MSAVPLNPGGHALDMTGWTQTHLARVEQALSQWVGHGAPAGLGDAMRYAVLDGGKRLRPLLVLAAYEAVCSGCADSSRPTPTGRIRRRRPAHKSTLRLRTKTRTPARNKDKNEAAPI